MSNNIKHQIIRRILVSLLLVLSLFLLSACGTKLTRYRKELSQHVDVIVKDTETLESTLSKLQSALSAQDGVIYEEQLEVLRSVCDEMVTEYKAIGDAEAPEEYVEYQKMLKDYAKEITDTIAAMPELYTLAGGAIGSELSDEAISRIGELQRKVAAASLKADEFDKVLNAVLGFEEE